MFDSYALTKYIVHSPAKPSVSTQPQSTTILINQTLSLSCSFRAKPPGTITWVYGGSGSPDISVLQIYNTTSPDGAYTISTSIISWLSDDDNKRKSVSGQYKCQATNSAGNVESSTSDLDIQCE